MDEKEMRRFACAAANRRNEVESSELYSEWKMVENVMYKSNSNTRKPKIVRTVPVKSRGPSYCKEIASSILPTKEEFILDILFPTIGRSIRSALLG